MKSSTFKLYILSMIMEGISSVLSANCTFTVEHLLEQSAQDGSFTSYEQYLPYYAKTFARTNNITQRFLAFDIRRHL